MAATVFLRGRSLAKSIWSIFLLCMESNSLEKSTKNRVALRIFTRTSSKIRQIVIICDVVNRFLRKVY